MILKALTLENFKGIREPVRIEFAPLTLLFGPNNAGKSTIVQALMYAREVLERNNCDAGRTALGGEVIDLGGFGSLVYGHDVSRVIRMRFELNLRNEALPEESDWVREHELDNNVTQFYRNAPKRLDISSCARLTEKLVDVWVEIEIAWSEVQGGPAVRTYSVGAGHDRYATISFGDALRQASLTYFNFGVYPFGITYTKGDLTEFEWELAKSARSFLRKLINDNDVPALGLTKGATVALVGEEIEESDNRLSRQRFDEIVTRIIQGEGAWGNSTLDEQTGEHNWQYSQRQRLLKYAELCASAKSVEASFSPFLDLELFHDVPPIFPSDRGSDDAPGTDASEAKGTLNQASLDANTAQIADPSAAPQSVEENEYPDDEWESRVEHLTDGEDEQVESWMLEFFVALLRDGYVPVDPDSALPLNYQGSALPEWGRTLHPDYQAWMPDKWNEFWEYPAFAQEYFKDILSLAIVKPGERLLTALKDAIYVSPFRAMPPRHYQPARSPDPRRWADGLAAWDWLLLKDKTFAAQVNEWISNKERFHSGYAIDLRHYRELEIDSPILTALTAAVDGDLDRNWVREELLKLTEGRRLQIKDLRSGISLFPQDLGVGISQVIPVIVAALHNIEGIVAIEEPESNIHPAFQVVLADLFMSQAKANPELQFLVETHSEHLMLRCLRRIRETSAGCGSDDDPKVAPEDISVNFVEPDEQGQPRIHRIRLDEEGEFLDPWPRGFFRERSRELYGDDL